MNYSLSPHITEMLLRLAHNPSPELEMAVRMASEGLEKGHVCLNLRELASKGWLSPEGKEELPVPDLREWRDILFNSGVVGLPGEYRPLILDSHLLYFQRHYDDEQRITDFINSRRGRFTDNLDPETLQAGLQRLFPDYQEPGGAVNWQRVAAFLALTGRLTVISGGPGTGKTTTVARILALLLEQGNTRRIRLAAPTGKAAARLQDSLAASRHSLPVSPGIMETFPDRVSTIHRLLGKDRGRLKYDGDNQLAADAVIIDEASMVDLALMADLMAAIPESCSLILLGDRYQLASVQPGAVFADICQGRTQSFTGQCSLLAREVGAGSIPADSGDSRSDMMVELQANYRFSKDSGIGLLSQLVKNGRRDEALALLTSGDQPGLTWHNLDLYQGSPAAGEIVSRTAPQYRRLTEAADPETALMEMKDTVILCGLRRGPFGSATINRLLEEFMGVQAQDPLYHGRPVMILRNDYKRELYNGDTGIVCRDPRKEGELRCFFPDREEVFSPFKLPDHETAYAMTVHKSQGSEYDNIVLVLSDTSSPVLTRELLYTGITRARCSVEIWSTPGIFRETVEKKTVRYSGLVNRLNREG